MVNIETARQLALALPETEEKSHFEKPDFRLRNKIFASLHVDKKIMMITLSAVDQSVFNILNPENIYPVPGGWGLKGATYFELKHLSTSIVADALKCGWKNVASPTLLKKYFPEVD
jgi:hypothetical protein